MPPADSHMSKSLVTMITIVGGLVGAIAGGTGMWFTLKDRMEKQIETRVTRDLQVESRLVRLEEKIEAVRAEQWATRTTPAK